MCLGGCALFPDLGALAEEDAATFDAGADASKDAATFDAGADASKDAGSETGTSDATDAAPASIALVQSTGDTTPTTSTSLTVNINASGSGHLLVVALTQETAATATVAGVTDDVGNTYVSANQRSVDSSCDNTAELWYAAASKPGAKKVTVAMSANVGFEVWIAELSGISTQSPLVTGAATSGGSQTSVPAPPVNVTAVPALVVSVASSCGAISGIQNGNPFMPLMIQDDQDTAYAIVSAAGSYGATWSYSGGTWNASTAEFR